MPHVNAGGVSMVVFLSNSYYFHCWTLATEIQICQQQHGCNIPRTLKHKISIQNASSHVYITMIMQLLRKANTFGLQHNFQSKIFYLMFPMPRIIYYCPHFICNKIMAKMSKSLQPCVICLVMITILSFFECCCTTTFIQHPHKGEVRWWEEF